MTIAFETKEEAGLPEGKSGYGDSSPQQAPDGTQWYVTGRVVIVTDDGWTEGPGSAQPLSVMLMHELGHVVGLAHVQSALEVMGNEGARAWGSGDRAGLAAVGRPAGCRP